MKLITYEQLTPELARAGCFVTGMSNDAYHAYEGISKSGLDKVSRSPAHFYLSAQGTSSPAMRMGTIVHTAILEPERFKEEYVLLKDISDKRKSEYKEAAKVFGSENVLTSKEVSSVASLQETIQADQPSAELLASCDLFELSAFVEHKGVLLRCRYDAFSSRDLVAVDLKTTQNSSRAEFAKSVSNYRYHVQDAHYSLVYELITGKKLNAFKFLAVENEPPHCPMIYELSAESKLIGLHELNKDLIAYKAASENCEWIGYEQTNEPLDLPYWTVNAYEDELDAEIV